MLFDSQKKAYRYPFTPAGEMVLPTFAGLSLRSKANTATAHLVQTSTKCSGSSECGKGFYCHNGICVSSGGGNTFSGASGYGCSVGPDGVDAGTWGNGRNCGSNSGGAPGGCYGAGCGQGSSSDSCGNSDSNPGERCCREDSNGLVRCGKGQCPPEPSPCSSYCTAEKASYGESGDGCDSRNECTECADCVDNNCVPKSDADRPCHCEDECAPPGEEITCCSYQDTCKGRIEGKYCHPTYRTGLPRCYNPDVTCEPTDGYCVTCTTGFGPEVPDGCTQRGFITNDDTGETIYLYECCDFKKDDPACVECTSDEDCPRCQYCSGTRGCMPLTPCPPEPSVTVWVRMVGTAYGNGFYGPSTIEEFVTQWYNYTDGYMLGSTSAESTVCLNSIEGGPGVTGAARTIKNQSGCASTGSVIPVGVYKNNVLMSADGPNVGFSWFYPDSNTVLWWFNGVLQYSYNQQDVFHTDSGFKDPSLPDNPPYP